MPITVTGQGDASSFRRPVDGRDKIVVSGKITHEKTNLKGAVMWRAPEYNGDYVMAAGQNGVSIVVNRRTANVRRHVSPGTRWLPSATPFAWSPEFFIHDGKPYVFFQMNTSANWNGYTKPNLLAMIGILEENSTIQKLVPSGATSRARTDPEYFITAQGAVHRSSTTTATPTATAPCPPKASGGWTPGWARRWHSRPAREPAAPRASNPMAHASRMRTGEASACRGVACQAADSGIGEGPLRKYADRRFPCTCLASLHACGQRGSAGNVQVHSA